VGAPVWGVVAAALRAGRVARAAEIDPGLRRASRVTVLHGRPLRAGAYALPPAEPGAAPAAILHERVPAPCEVDAGGGGWVRVRQGAVTYALDATRTMFSSGNASEKARMGALAGARGQTVVDLYAGIGYFTLQLLVAAGAAHVHAADWNPDAVRTLRLNLAANGVSGRATVWPGDNAALAGSAVAGTADRVLLGLIPSSEAGWAVGLACLKPSGGTLHVHANVADAALAGWVADTAAELQRLAAAAGRRWRVAAAHVERVKSYAPRVSHVVADMVCEDVV
jgi:tRNA G37 N-methylase Trm5